MTGSFVPAQSGYSRVFLIEGRARGDHAPSYESCLKAGSPSQSFGDETTIECPDPTKVNGFIEVGSVKGAKERATIDLTGRLAVDLESTLLRLARQGCPVDVQVHLGECKDPSVFNSFDSAFILENAGLSSWGTDGDLGALSSDEKGVVNETTSISAYDMYQVLPLSMAEKAASVVTNEVVDVTICGSVACGSCGDQSDGCDHIYAITIAAGGSPSTPADIVFSIDKGVTWYADDIDSLGVAEDPDAIACVGLYIVVVSNASNSLHYALKSEVDNVDYDETWTEVTTGFVASAEPNDIWSYGSGAFIVGDGGYVYRLDTEVTSGVTVIDAGNATSDDLHCVHAPSSAYAIAGGANGAIIYTLNGTEWTAATNPVGVGTRINCCWMVSRYVWWVGCSDGTIWYTTNSGGDWTQKADWGASVYDIAFATDSVVYAAYATSTPRGGIRRSYDGGYSWMILPEDVGTIPASDRINAIAACREDPNFVVGVGLGDDGSDGYVVIGAD